MEEGCSIHLSKPFESKKSAECIRILVVDDDLTCLAILSSILRKFKYRVVAVKHPTDALRTLRINGGGFDLVISDVHMPDMNGFQLQQAIAQEFQIPVILTSADNNESIASRGSICGAACFLLKPVKPDDLRDLWQMAPMNKRTQVEIIQGEHSVELSNSTTMTTASSSSTVTTNKKNKKRKANTNEVCDGKQGESCSPFPALKKSKIVWTNALHNRFLEALRNIGLDRAVPKRILELMDVPGLTRENVASHLQKYRIFLRRVTDASFRMQHNVDGLSLNRNPETNLGSLSASSSTNTSLTNFNQPSTLLQDLEPSSYTSIVKPTIGNLSWLPPQNDLQAYNWSNNYYENLIHSVPSHGSSLPLANFSSFLRACLDTPGPRNYNFGNKQSVAGLGQPDDHLDFDSPGDSFSAMASYSVHMPQYDLLSARQQYDNLTTFADPRNFLNEVGGTIAANSNNCDGVSDLDTILQSSDAVGNQQSSNPFSHISQQLADSCQLSKALIPPSNKEPVCESSTRFLRFGSVSQINIIPQSPVEQLEEEFLNSLIAQSDEAPTLTGILSKRT